MCPRQYVATALRSRTYNLRHMKKPALAAAGFTLLGWCVSARAQSAQPAAAAPAARETAVVQQYCAVCHSDRGKAGGLSLAGFDVDAVAEHAPVGEKMI